MLTGIELPAGDRGCGRLVEGRGPRGLALPGWFVKTKALGPVSVQNAKNLPSCIRGKGKPVLSTDDIKLIRLQLDSRCRDVED